MKTRVHIFTMINPRFFIATRLIKKKHFIQMLIKCEIKNSSP